MRMSFSGWLLSLKSSIIFYSNIATGNSRLFVSPAEAGSDNVFVPTQGLRPGLVLFRPCGAWILRNSSHCTNPNSVLTCALTPFSRIDHGRCQDEFLLQGLVCLPVLRLLQPLLVLLGYTRHCQTSIIQPISRVLNPDFALPFPASPDLQPFCRANNALSFAPSPRSMFMRACRARCP